jgi:hypothetical protein
MCLLKPDLPKKLQDAIASDDESKERWDRYQQRTEQQYNINSKQILIGKDKQQTKTNTNPLAQINYANLSIKQIHHAI